MTLGIESLNHFVLTVADAGETVRFYNGILGMKVETFDKDRLALRFGNQKINIHVAGQEFEPHAAKPLRGSADFCLVSSRPMAELIQEIETRGGAIELGPVPRTGATSPLQSIFLREPDGNLVEIANKA